MVDSRIILHVLKCCTRTKFIKFAATNNCVIKMIEINFGISSHSRHSPGVPWEERRMEIPETGKLPDIPETFAERYLPGENACMFRLQNYRDVRGDVYEVLPAVCFRLRDDHSHSTYEMYMIWLERRGEWVAVMHHSWSEGNFNVDESEDGPYAPDAHCNAMLRYAYKLPREILPDHAIIRTRPSELERFHRKI